jgi:predicted kinase
VVLVGASSSGKTTYARRHFRATEIASSDQSRALVADDENAMHANREAFRLLRTVARARLRLGRLTVIDATNLQPASRRSWIALGRAHEVPVTAIVFDLPLHVLEERSRGRSDRRIPLEVVRDHQAQAAASVATVTAEGFDGIHVIRSVEDAEGLAVEREPAAAPSGPDLEQAALRWKRTWEAAWPRKDVEAITALYHPTATYRALIFRAPDLGVDGVRRYLQGIFEEEEDIVCRFGPPVVGEDRAAVEWWASWTEQGRPLTLAGTTLLRFDASGLVVDHRDYWNQVDEPTDPYPGW